MKTENVLPFEQKKGVLNYTAKKDFVKLTDKFFQVIFSLKTEHGIFANDFQLFTSIVDVGYSMKLGKEFIELVLEKYFYAREREVEAILKIRNRSYNRPDKVEEARIDAIEDRIERESNDPENLYL